jgi:hypothetical protein
MSLKRAQYVQVVPNGSFRPKEAAMVDTLADILIWRVPLWLFLLGCWFCVFVTRALSDNLAAVFGARLANLEAWVNAQPGPHKEDD